MTQTAPQSRPYLRPLPKVSGQFPQFWDAIAEHRFVVPRCQGCGWYNWVPYPGCRQCLGTDLDWVEVSGRGTVYSYTIVHRGMFNEDGKPYGIVMGSLDGPTNPCIVTANIVDDTDLDSLHIGMPVQIAYDHIPREDYTMYRWTGRLTSDGVRA